MVQAQNDKQVTNPSGVRAERVVPTGWLRGPAMPKQIWCNHVGVPAQQRQYRPPGRGAAGQAVQQHDDRPTSADTALQEGDTLTMQQDLPLRDLDRGLGTECRA